MARISSEELQRKQQEQRHKQMMSALETIAAQNAKATEEQALLRQTLAQSVAVLQSVANRKIEMPAQKDIDLKPLIAEVVKGMQGVAAKIQAPERQIPKSFRIERDTQGRMCDIIPQM